MAISAQRFKFLDKETNMPTYDFYQVSNNIVYNAAGGVTNSTIASIGESEGLLDSINGSMSELSDMVSSTVESIGKDLTSALNSAIDTISKMSLPKIVTDIFDKLKSLDLGGVKGFIKDLLNVGSSILCNNTDFLKLFTLGYAINKNIIGGLLTALMLSWLDRVCGGGSKAEMSKLTGLEKLEKTVKTVGTAVDKSNAFKTFTTSYADLIKSKVPLTTTTPLDTVSFLSNIKTGNVDYSLSSLRKAEISYTDKSEYMANIDSELANYSLTSPEGQNLLKARGDLINLPLISEERIDKNMTYSNLSDRLGSMSNNLVGVDLSNISTFNLSTTEVSLTNKIKEYQKTVENNSQMAVKDNDTGSYDDVDFENIMPELSNVEVAYVNDTGGSDSAHREQDMHPTTSVFLENC